MTFGPEYSKKAFGVPLQIGNNL